MRMIAPVPATEKPAPALLAATLSMIVAEALAPTLVTASPAPLLAIVVCLKTLVTAPVPVGTIRMPYPDRLLSETIVLEMKTVVEPLLGLMETPVTAKRRTTQLTMVSEPPLLIAMPLPPAPRPSMLRPRRVTLSDEPAVMVIAVWLGVGCCTPAVPTPSLTML